MAIGHEYMVQTDHSARLTIAHGLNEERLSEQLDQIADLNAAITEAGHDFRVLSGMEVDILVDGSLDLSDDMLERLDTEQYDGSRQLRVVALKHADARSVARAINEAFEDTRPKPPAPQPAQQGQQQPVGLEEEVLLLSLIATSLPLCYTWNGCVKDDQIVLV